MPDNEYLRDFFAGLATHSVMQDLKVKETDSQAYVKGVASVAYMYADAMLEVKELRK